MPLFDWIRSDLHNLNLDWIISKIKTVEESEQGAVDAAADAQASKTAAASSATAANNSKTAAAASATAAAGSAAQAQALVDHLDTTIAQDVSDWLENNLTPTSPPVDDTLTIQGAAADAKKTGDEITDLKTNFNNCNYAFSAVSGEYVDVFNGGAFTPYASFSRTGYLPVNDADIIYIVSGGASQYNAFYDASYNFVSKFTLSAGENTVIVPSGATYFAISEATADLASTVVKNTSWFTHVKLDKVTEKAPTLANVEDVIIGQNWTQGSATNRAVIWVDCEPNTEYFLKIPASTAFNDISIVQKATKSGASLNAQSYANNSEQTFTTVNNAAFICVQFNGILDITSADFNGYEIYLIKASERYTAVDTTARNEKQKKYIFIGDSYCEGYNPDGNTTGWGNRLKTAMNLSDENCMIKYKGGTGFYHVSDGKTFSTLLDEAGAMVIKSAITDIVICGGWNDNSESLSNVYNAVLAMIAKVRTEYPNAKLHIGMIGASNNATVKQKLQNIVLYSYQYGAMADVCDYLNNVEYALSESNLASDGIHPNADGQVQITMAIKQALETGCAFIPYRFYNQIKTS